jgi:hypothetical protein
MLGHSFGLKLRGCYTDLNSVILRNDGVGPAVITAATFTKNGRSTNRLVELIDVDIPLWQTFTGISRRRVVPPREGGDPEDGRRDRRFWFAFGG